MNKKKGMAEKKNDDDGKEEEEEDAGGASFHLHGVPADTRLRDKEGRELQKTRKLQSPRGWRRFPFFGERRGSGPAVLPLS